MEDLSLLILRAATGGLLAGHGAQKLFGWFEGPGPHGTRGWLEALGLRPGHYWAAAAGASEFAGGLLTALGFLNPLGPLGIAGSMGMAWAKVHWGKPIWVTSGGAELPLTNMAVAAALMLSGPGKYSLDNLLGIRLPRWLALPGLATAAAVIYIGTQQTPQQPAQAAGSDAGDGREIAGAELQAGDEAAHPV